MLKAFWDFLTNNKDPIDTLIKILTFLVIPIGALITLLTNIIRRWLRSRLRQEINAFDFIFDSNALLARVYNEENNNNSFAHHKIGYQSRSSNRDIQSELHTILRTSSKYLLIEGRTGLGKTREATTLVKSLMNEGYRVIRITTAWLDMPKEFPKELNNDRRRILFLLDDLNGLFRSGDFTQSPNAEQFLIHNHDSYHDRLLRTIDTFEKICGKNEILVIATARNEAIEWDVLKFDNRDALWSRFHRFELPEPTDESLIKLVDNFAIKVKLQIDRPELSLIIGENDGTYMNVVLNLQRLKKENKTLSLGNYTPTLDGSWRHVYERAVQTQPAIAYIYDAIDVMRQMGVDLFIWIIEPMAVILWGGNSIQRFFRRFKIKNAIKYLIHDEKIIAKNNDEFRPRDGQIEAKGTQIDWKPLALNIQHLITNFAEQRPKELSKSLLGLSHALIEKDFLDEALFLMRKRTELLPQNSQLWIELDSLLETLQLYEEAEHALQKAIACQPNDAHPYFHLGTLSLETKKLTEAEEAFRKAISLDPSNYASFAALGYILHTLQRTTEAEEAYLKSIALESRYDPAHNGLGNLLLDLGRIKEAEDAYRQAILISPDSGDGYLNLSRLLFTSERYSEAEDFLRKAIELDNTNAKAHFNLGLVLRKLERLREAIDSFREGLKWRNNEISALFELGAMHLELENYNEAEEAYQTIIEFGSNSEKATAQYNLGVMYFTQNQTQKAIELLRQAISSNSDFLEPYWVLGELFEKLEQLNDAEDLYRLAVNQQPENAHAYYSLGNFLDRLDRNLDAVEAFHNAIKYLPNYGQAYNNLGISLKKLERTAEAEHAFQQAIEFDSTIFEPYLNLGMELIFQERFDEAEKNFQQALVHCADRSEVHSEYAQYLVRNNRFSEAIPLFKKAYELQPQQSHLLYLAGCFQKIGDQENSLKYASEAKALTAADDWYNLACLATIVGNTETAFEHLERAALEGKFNPEWAQKDPDLETIRKDPRFLKIITIALEKRLPMDKDNS